MDSIKKLTELFAKFPTVGPRTAGRFVFYLINQPKEAVQELLQTIGELKNSVALCTFCFNPHQTGQQLCEICQNTSRNRQLLCIVEKETDLLSIEKTGKYKGLYFILGGTISFKKTIEDLRIQELKERLGNTQKFGIENLSIGEIIIATNPTPEGKATSIAIEQELKTLPQFPRLKITHLAQGLPVGGELEYADEETLQSAFEGRK